ncbi:hypothetical protein ALQ30_200371 [Pseudomonas syringae pv. persicae]|uniref:Uncharacterized protein n=1 Tax=Pseudomonas syringae pv. persicae TaxID=237306 RepID=A0A3M4AJV0_9PSED|nr:hypothetical protein ALQ30_200371 [Pseudomonas syringae pv. persicae]
MYPSCAQVLIKRRHGNPNLLPFSSNEEVQQAQLFRVDNAVALVGAQLFNALMHIYAIAFHAGFNLKGDFVQSPDRFALIAQKFITRTARGFHQCTIKPAGLGPEYDC